MLRRLAALFLTALLAMAATAQAQSRPTGAADVRAQLPPDARKAWQAALQLAGANDVKGALVEFQRAYDLSHNPRVLYNIGITEKMLTHYARATDRWEQELKEGAGQLTPAEVQELHNAIDIVKQFVTTLDVTSTEPGATLFVDDYSVGTTPFPGPVRVDIGRRVLRMTKDGFKEATQTVDVAGGTNPPVRFKLDPTTRTARVTVTVVGPPNAVVFMDGTEMGPAPYKADVPATRHTFEARAIGFATKQQTVDVQYGQPVNVTLTLVAREGKLRISAPDGALIEVDGKVVGDSSWEGTVPTTSGHEVIVKKPGFQTFTSEVNVGDGETRDVKVPLNRSQATTWVWWTIGAVAVVGAGTVLSYFVLRAGDANPYHGNLDPGVQPARFRF